MINKGRPSEEKIKNSSRDKNWLLILKHTVSARQSKWDKFFNIVDTSLIHQATFCGRFLWSGMPTSISVAQRYEIDNLEFFLSSKNFQGKNQSGTSCRCTEKNGSVKSSRDSFSYDGSDNFIADWSFTKYTPMQNFITSYILLHLRMPFYFTLSQENVICSWKNSEQCFQ